jgi:hypothetical protein
MQTSDEIYSEMMACLMDVGRDYIVIFTTVTFETIILCGSFRR